MTRLKKPGIHYWQDKLKCKHFIVCLRPDTFKYIKVWTILSSRYVWIGPSTLNWSMVHSNSVSPTTVLCLIMLATAQDSKQYQYPWYQTTAGHWASDCWHCSGPAKPSDPTILSSPVDPQLLGRNAARDQAESLTELTGATLRIQLESFHQDSNQAARACSDFAKSRMADWPISCNPLAWTEIPRGGGSWLLEELPYRPLSLPFQP